MEKLQELGQDGIIFTQLEYGEWSVIGDRMVNSHNARGGGFTKVHSSTPTVSVSPNYSSGDAMGGLITFTNFGRRNRLAVEEFGGAGIIQSVVITDLAAQSLNIDVIFFDTNPSNTTVTDNATLDVHDTDLLTILGIVNVTSWADFSDNSVGFESNLGIPFDLGAGNSSIYAVMVARGAHNLASTSDLTLRVGVLQD